MPSSRITHAINLQSKSGEDARIDSEGNRADVHVLRARDAHARERAQSVFSLVLDLSENSAHAPPKSAFWCTRRCDHCAADGLLDAIKSGYRRDHAIKCAIIERFSRSVDTGGLRNKKGPRMNCTPKVGHQSKLLGCMHDQV
jgi:hypothetical protein